MPDNPNPNQTNESFTSSKDYCNKSPTSNKSMSIDELISPPASAESSRGMQESRFVYHNPTQPNESFASIKEYRNKLPTSNKSLSIEYLTAPPATAESSYRNRFVCDKCSKEYQGTRQLSRHMLQHNEPNKYSCPVDGCKKTAYRKDSIRSHVRTHERRIKVEQEYINK
jgi:uncharacterized Zn-finger protein